MIQQPIPKLQILNFHNFFNQSDNNKLQRAIINESKDKKVVST